MERAACEHGSSRWVVRLVGYRTRGSSNQRASTRHQEDREGAYLPLYVVDGCQLVSSGVWTELELSELLEELEELELLELEELA